jgi:hypothetical protein
MKTEDQRDEGIARLLEEAARQLQPVANVTPVLRRGSRRRAARFTATVVAVAVFVGGIGWAGLSIRDNRASTAWRSYGSAPSTTWTISYPGDWHVETTNRCSNAPRLAGAVFTNVSFTVRNPQGRTPGCEDRFILAGFPRNGVVVALMPVGVLPEIFFPTPATPFPIRMAQFFDAGSIAGGFQTRYLPVEIGRDQPLIVRTWIGPDASAQARADVVRVVGSLRMPGTATWTMSAIARKQGVTISTPSDWHVSVRTGGVMISSFTPRPSAQPCPIPVPNVLGGVRYADAMIWIPLHGSKLRNVPPQPLTTGTATPLQRVVGCARTTFPGGPIAWRSYQVPIGSIGSPPVVKVKVVYGFNALREPTGRIVSLILASLRLGGAP